MGSNFDPLGKHRLHSLDSHIDFVTVLRFKQLSLALHFGPSFCFGCRQLYAS